jgi:hypothetical protein
MDPSKDAKLYGVTPAIDLAYDNVNLTAAELVAALNGGAQVYQHFTPLPHDLFDVFEPSRIIFLSEEDHRLRKQFLWLSSTGCRTHIVSIPPVRDTSCTHTHTHKHARMRAHTRAHAYIHTPARALHMSNSWLTPGHTHPTVC